MKENDIFKLECEMKNIGVGKMALYTGVADGTLPDGRKFQLKDVGGDFWLQVDIKGKEGHEWETYQLEKKALVTAILDGLLGAEKKVK